VILSTPSQVTKRIRQLAAEQEDKFLDLGAQLIRLGAMASGAKFKAIVSWEGLGSRKAYYLINIVEKLRPHMRYRVRLQRLGWTKCQMLAAQLPGANFLALLEFAEAHTAKELETYIRRETPSGRTRCVLLYFTETQYRQYEKAALQFGARKRGRGLVDKEAATIRMSRTALLT
jgi:hypothetical protein